MRALNKRVMRVRLRYGCFIKCVGVDKNAALFMVEDPSAEAAGDASKSGRKAGRQALEGHP